MVVVDLDDELAQVGLQAFNATRLQKRREFDLLAHHGLCLYQALRAAALHDREHVLARRSGIDRPMNLRAAGLEAFLRQRQQGVEILDGMLLDLSREPAKAVGLGELGEQQLGSFLVRGLGAPVDGHPLLGIQSDRELVNGLRLHRGINGREVRQTGFMPSGGGRRMTLVDSGRSAGPALRLSSIALATKDRRATIR